MGFAALQACEAPKLTKIDVLESNERDRLDETRRYDQKLVTVRVEIERHEAQDVKSTKASTAAKVELANFEEALRVLKGRASAEMLAMRSAMEDSDGMQGKLVITSAKLEVARRALSATFGHRKQYTSNMQLLEAAVLKRLKSNFWNYVRKLFDQVKQCTEAYQLNKNGKISSVRTTLTQENRSMCAQITETPDMVRRDVSDSDEGRSSE